MDGPKPDKRYEQMAREMEWGHDTEVPMIRADDTIHCPLCGDSRSLGDRAGRSYTCSFKIALALERAAMEARINEWECIAKELDTVPDNVYVEQHRKRLEELSPTKAIITCDCVCGHKRMEHEPDCVFCDCGQFQPKRLEELKEGGR